MSSVKSINKLLVANRGEIAVRIIRACREIGIRSVAIYSFADRNALHVKKADEAYMISHEPLQGYLNPRRIVALAKSTRCDAIHPGYGFLSENPKLPWLCRRSNLIFIGPSSEAMELLGDKIEARKLVKQAGVPVVPGSDFSLADVDAAVELAEQIGYPVMLKATAGGGGRGIRRCEDVAELKQQFDRVRSEAISFFRNPDIFMEKCIISPKHIEVQIMGDQHGNFVHYFERDCSIQRRNQKLIEIAPSPQISQDLREKICRQAIKVAEAVDYHNAGTVEFLLADNQFYFLEMNTRIQVEHPISETITGIDLIIEQINVAAGNPVTYLQSDIDYRGFAIEFRINAEDPRNGFTPDFGKVTRYYAPGGPGVRTDAALYTGYSIPPYYDSMCAKLIVWGRDWNSVIARSVRALGDMEIAGIKTTKDYYQQILQSEAFRNANFDTSFVDTHPDLLNYEHAVPKEYAALAVAASIFAKYGC